MTGWRGGNQDAVPTLGGAWLPQILSREDTAGIADLEGSTQALCNAGRRGARREESIGRRSQHGTVPSRRQWAVVAILKDRLDPSTRLVGNLDLHRDRAGSNIPDVAGYLVRAPRYQDRRTCDRLFRLRESRYAQQERGTGKDGVSLHSLPPLWLS